MMDRSIEVAPTQPLTAAEIKAHPEFPYVFWKLKPTEKGSLCVAKDRGRPVNIAYEVHGDGQIYLVWIMGLAATKAYWQRQTKDFSHTQGNRYTSLIFDNRGIGESDKPLMRYSTSEMAEDLLELLQHLGWTMERQLHIIGISMGGMIAQELALRIPDRIASLTLLSTAARLVNTVGYLEHLQSRISLFIPRSLDSQLANTKRNIYTPTYPLLPDDAAKTKEYVIQPFPSNGDRFAAFEMHKRLDRSQFKLSAFLSQAAAAAWHHKSPEKIKEIGDKVGRGRIQVVHGTEDKMISFPHGETLVRELGGRTDITNMSKTGIEKQKTSKDEVTVRFIEGQAHVIPVEMRWEFKLWLEELIEKTETMKARGDEYILYLNNALP